MERLRGMITIPDLLPAGHLALELISTTSRAAIDEVAALLKSDPAVNDWDALLTGVQAVAPCLPEESGGFAICIPHTRGECVASMVMSVGRSTLGVSFPGVDLPVRYIFCIAVPRALAADYLRIVGLLARVFKDPAAERELRAATTPDDFIALLASREARL